MAKSPLYPHTYREWWCLLLIPFTFVLLDSYGWLSQNHPPAWTTPENTVYHVQADRAQTLSLAPPEQGLSTEPLKTRLTHPSGDVHLLVTQADANSIDLQVPALPPGHYPLRIGQGETPVLQDTLHVQPHPKLALDRYFVQAGETLSLWRKEPIASSYRMPPFADQALTAQNPYPIPVPKELPAGKHQLQIAGMGSVAFEVLAAPNAAVTVKPHHDLVLPGVDQVLYLHVLDAQQLPLKQGWIRINEQSYPIKNGLAVVDLPKESVRSELAFTAGIAEGKIEQGTLSLQLANAPWAIALIPAQPEAAHAQHLQWVGTHRETLFWQAQQGHQTEQGKLSKETPLKVLYERLQHDFKSEQPISLRFVDTQGRGQSMGLQFFPRVANFKTQPAQPHALSDLKVTSPAPLTPWVNHYLPGHYGWSQAAPVFGDETLDVSPPGWRFFWLLAGLLCSGIPWWLARQRTYKWQANLDQGKRLKQARTGVLVGASLWLLSLPAAWLNESLFMGQSYLLGLTLSSLSLIWALRKPPLLQPVWVFTQTALLLLCFWFNLTYWPEGQGAVILWTGLLSLAWLSLFARWQRSTPLYNSRLVLAAALATLSILQSIVSLQSAHTIQAPTQTAMPTERQQVISHSHYPVALPQLTHSRTSPAAFSLTGQGGAHTLSGRDPQGWRYLQVLNVMETPRVQTEAPAIAQQNDLVQLPIHLSNLTPATATLPLRLQGPQLNTRHTETLKAGEKRVIYLPIRYPRSGIHTYTLSQFYDGKWQTQNWQTYVNPAPVSSAQDTSKLKFSPLRLQVTYPEQSSQVGGEIPVVVDFQHRLPEDTALQLSIGIPAGFTAITDTLMTDKHKAWLADFRPSISSLNIETTVLRAGQRVRFHYRLKAAYAGEFQTPEAVLSSPAVGSQREFAQSTLLKVSP